MIKKKKQCYKIFSCKIVLITFDLKKITTGIEPDKQENTKENSCEEN